MKNYFLIFSALLAVNLGEAKTVTVHYFPETGVSTYLMFAFSPDATDAAPSSNPTVFVAPQTSFKYQLPDDVRTWYFTAASGWAYLAASTEPQVGYDATLVVYSTDSAPLVYTMPQTVDSSSGVAAVGDILELVAIFLGLGVTLFGLTYGVAYLLRVFKTFASD